MHVDRLCMSLKGVSVGGNVRMCVCVHIWSVHVWVSIVLSDFSPYKLPRLSYRGHQQKVRSERHEQQTGLELYA